jgi:energy-coupling factor transporter ATP-binding protein EcfA2
LSDGQEAVACTSVDDALGRIKAQPTGRLLVRGSNGSGKSTLLVALKARLGSKAFYWPTSDKLAFAFSGATADEDDEPAAGGFSSGERQLKSLQEIVSRTHAAVYLLDEWDANLDAKNRASAESLVAQLAARAVVVEISHRDRV